MPRPSPTAVAAGPFAPAPIGFAVAYGVAAAISLWLTRGGDGIAAMWPASGILLAGLLWLPAGGRRWCLAWTGVASLVANLHAGNDAWASLVFTVANIAEGAVGAWIVGATGTRRPSFIDPRDVGRFALAACVAAATSSAVAWLGAPAESTLFAISWFTTVLLGMLIVAPAALIGIGLVERDGSVPMPDVSLREGAALIVGLTAVTSATFSQPLPLLFLPLVALLGITYRLGPLGAALGVLVVAMAGSVLTGFGLGPIAQAEGPTVGGVFLFQFFLLVGFGAALPLAALLAAQRRLATQCAASERMHRLLADTSSDIIVRLKPSGAPLYVSSAVERVLGFPPAAFAGSPGFAIHPEDRPAVEAVWAELLATGAEQRFVFRQRRYDGGYAWLEAACRLVRNEAGQREIVASVRDVTERRAAEAAAERAARRTTEANRLLGLAERVAQVGHWRLDMGSRAVVWSPELFRIHGFEGDTPPAYEDALAFYHPDDRERIAGVVEAALAAAAPFEAEARLVRTDGGERHVVVRGQPEFDADGAPVALFGVLLDVTRQVLAERELDRALRAAEEAAARAIRMADTDALTGVASRRKAMAELDDALAEAEATGAPLALAIFDIDHFKAVNDRFGHAAGDAVLRRVARAARQAVRPTDLVGRLGGEEFVVLLPGMGEARALELAETLRRAIAASADGIEAGPPVTASIGVALKVPGGSAASLLGEADRALYRAKAAGRNAARLAA